jgi:hypothetical protein
MPVPRLEGRGPDICGSIGHSSFIAPALFAQQRSRKGER